MLHPVEQGIWCIFKRDSYAGEFNEKWVGFALSNYTTDIWQACVHLSVSP